LHASSSPRREHYSSPRRPSPSIATGRFRVSGLYLYRIDSFKPLRALMYATTVLLVVPAALALADALGADILG
jgi:hypothetical protein